MKKILLAITTLTTFSCAYAQKKATLNNDTLYYAGKAFYVGDTLQLWYGGNPDKTFAFIKVDLGLSQADAPASWSKTTIVVSKIYNHSGKYYLKTKGERNNTFIVDVEGAIDNKELLP